MKSKCCQAEVINDEKPYLNNKGVCCSNPRSICSKCKQACDIFQPLTHEEKLTAVREKIIEACPELLDLTLGCVVITGIPENQTRRIIGNEIIKDDDTRDYGIGKWIILSSKARTSILKIIGHDPRLEHVLRALDKNIGLWQWHPTYKPITVIEALLYDANWELEKDLSGQTEATIDFLYSVFYGS